MHPAISEFPSLHFYGGRLIDSVVASERPTPPGFPWPVSDKGEVVPVAFLDVNYGSEQDSQMGGSKTKENRAEAELVVKLVDSLLAAKGLTPKNIGIISVRMMTSS
jgi:superfamily I DNA and/or RNA helicase